MISLAARQCDELIVSLSDAPNDPYQMRLKIFRMVEEAFSLYPNVRVWSSLKDDFDREDLSMVVHAQRFWAAIVNKTYDNRGKSSPEAYGDAFAHNLGAASSEFDREREERSCRYRNSYPERAFNYWEFIP